MRVEDLFDAPPRARVRLERRRGVAGIAFPDDTRVALLYGDGQLETRDLDENTVLATLRSNAVRATRLIAAGTTSGTIFPNGDACTFDAGADEGGTSAAAA